MSRRAATTRVLTTLFLVLFLACALPATSSAAVPPPAGTSRPAASLLRLGDHGPAVRALQATLARLTYLLPSAVDGSFGTQTWHAVVAFQGWSGIGRDGVVGPLTQSALAHARVPTPWSTATGIEVHTRQQVLLLVSGGRVVRAIHVATGKPSTPTPGGHFTIQARYTMSWSVRFKVWMPLAQYFDDGYAIHEFADVPAYPASHGCVRVPSSDAQAVWQFGRIGMRVWTAP
jgi:lipoprotein-anchoring transpeptidase ErfK/SrfK